MKKVIQVFVAIAIAFTIVGCERELSQTKKTAKAVARQQGQFNVAQPLPVYDFSIERDLVIQLYNIRNLKVVTHSVWRGDLSIVEGDCPSLGFSIPYDTSLTNPLVAYSSVRGMTSIEQAEPNGIFASKNTSATWVMCVNDNGGIDPIYVEAKVSVYPYPVKVDYETNRVTKSGKSSVSLTVK